MGLGESSTKHYVINLIHDCMALSSVSDSPSPKSEMIVTDLQTAAETHAFSSLICGTEKVKVMEVGVGCEQS